jgi:hypothetical protein
MSSKNIDVAIRVPYSEFLAWMKQFAPELSPDAALKEIIIAPEQEEFIVRAKTDRGYYNDYKRKVTATKPR